MHYSAFDESHYFSMSIYMCVCACMCVAYDYSAPISPTDIKIATMVDIVLRILSNSYQHRAAVNAINIGSEAWPGIQGNLALCISLMKR